MIGCIFMDSLHRVLINVIGDCLAFGIADGDCARIVHTSPDPRGVTLCSRLRDAGVYETRLSRRQPKCLLVVEVDEENRCGGAVEAWCPQDTPDATECLLAAPSSDQLWCPNCRRCPRADRVTRRQVTEFISAP